MAPMPVHVSPEFVLNSLRLLLEGYKVARDRFKDKKTPDHVEDIVIRAEKAPQADTKEIERSLNESLDPADAAIVKGDLELLRLLMLPEPSLDAFDYWGKLTQFVAGLQAYATKNRLFELRGTQRQPFGEVLYLSKTGNCILPPEVASRLPRPYSRESLKDVNCLVLLRKETKDFPIVVLVRAEFNEYHPTGGPPSVAVDTCCFDIGQGQQRHWLSFDCGMRSSGHFLQASEYRLEASNLISIVQALRDDIGEFAIAVQADEQKIRPLFAAIDAFAKGLNVKT
jgi:hypothetical protein